MRLYFNGKSSSDFNVHISGSGVYAKPSRKVTSISVPGRNGDVLIDEGSYENIEIAYPAFIVRDFSNNYAMFTSFISSSIGYKRLEDDYEPDFFRMAECRGAFAPKMTTLNYSGEFNISFNSMPQRWLKEGERSIEVTSSLTINNPTFFEAAPLIRAYGKGSFFINDVECVLLNVDGYIDLDFEKQIAYKDGVICDQDVSIHKYPLLISGLNEISLAGVERLEIIPRWWTI